MDYKRADRVGDQIQREVARMLQEDVKDPRIGMVTISSVEVTQDLRYAKVFYTCYGSEADRQETAEGLQKATGYVRRQIGQNLRLRFTPEISFHFDNSLDNAERINSILREIQERDSGVTAEDSDDSEEDPDADEDLDDDADAADEDPDDADADDAEETPPGASDR